MYALAAQNIRLSTSQLISFWRVRANQLRLQTSDFVVVTAAPAKPPPRGPPPATASSNVIPSQPPPGETTRDYDMERADDRVVVDRGLHTPNEAFRLDMINYYGVIMLTHTRQPGLVGRVGRLIDRVDVSALLCWELNSTTLAEHVCDDSCTNVGRPSETDDMIAAVVCFRVLSSVPKGLTRAPFANT